jgi:hypothetical protein
VVDDSGLLEENEVFIQIRKDNYSLMSDTTYSEQEGNLSDDTHILEGHLLVSRNPCTHPGDIRIL